MVHIIANIIGALFAIYGIFGLFLWLQSISVAYSWNIGTSIIAIVLGVMIISNPGFFLVVLPILIGLFLLFNWLSVRSILRRLKMREKEASEWKKAKETPVQEAEIVDKKPKK